METKKILASKNVILASVIAAVLLVAAVGSASANGVCVGATTNFSCGAIVTESCTLNASIDCTAGTHGLEVQTSNITIDGAGYTINGSKCLNDCGACAEGGQIGNNCRCGVALSLFNKKNITIKNLEIKNFCNGIAVRGPSSEITIEGCSIHDNGISTAADVGATHGITLDNQVKFSTITKCDIYDNTGEDTVACGRGGAGIKIFGVNSSYNEITCNDLHGNDLAGFYCKKKCYHNYIAYNNVYENGEDVGGATGWYGGGIVFKCKESNHETISYNNITNNYGPGIYTRGGNNTIRYNTIKDQKNASTKTDSSTTFGVGVGIFSKVTGDTLTNNTAYNNTCCNNTYLDFWDWNAGATRRLVGDSNTGDNCTNYHDEGETCCTYTCDNLISVYYDFDGDSDQPLGGVSDIPESCTCNNTLGVGSCCNPGLFNSSGYEDHCYLQCNSTHGDDPNDCDASVVGTNPVKPVPELATILLFGAGLITLVGYVELRKRRKG